MAPVPERRERGGYRSFRIDLRGPNRGYTNVPNKRADATAVTEASPMEVVRMKVATDKPNPNSSALAILPANG